MKDMREASYVIGIETFGDSLQGLLGLSHKNYIESVLERFNMHNCLAKIVPKQNLVSCNVQRIMWNERE